MSSARMEILARVRTAVPAGAPREPIPRAYRRVGARTPAEVFELFCERVSDYRARVQTVACDGLLGAIAEACGQHNARRIAVPPGLPGAWRPGGLELVEDRGLTPQELDRCDAVLTGCTLAIAETGTIILSAGETDGRRALSLIPDVHVCVVNSPQIVELVPEALERLADLVVTQRRPLTLVSGPSATSDIELSRVEGVHGPRKLIVLVVKESP